MKTDDITLGMVKVYNRIAEKESVSGMIPIVSLLDDSVLKQKDKLSVDEIKCAIDALLWSGYIYNPSQYCVLRTNKNLLVRVMSNNTISLKDFKDFNPEKLSWVKINASKGKDDYWITGITKDINSIGLYNYILENRIGYHSIKYNGFSYWIIYKNIARRPLDKHEISDEDIDKMVDESFNNIPLS